nr:T-cell receptor V beta CDR3 region {clone V8LK18} [mice, NOD, lymph node, Peptide Partial, 17 aa] [Mus sp.]
CASGDEDWGERRDTQYF